MRFVIVAGQTYILIGQNTSVGDSVNYITRTDLHCDWSFQIPAVNRQSCDLIGILKFLSLAQGLCPYTPDPFFLGGSGDETTPVLGIWSRVHNY